MAPQTPLRKRLTAIKEAVRAPLRPGGQSEQVLRTLERMRNAQRVAEEEDEKAYRFRLSPVAAGIALAVMAATVGWSYFMGYMVGLGQNPARQVARLTGGGHVTHAMLAGAEELIAAAEQYKAGLAQ